MKKVTAYTDGACSHNPGPGGWAAVLIYKGREKAFSGFEPETTNNRMELTSVLEALKALKEPCEVDIYTDSAYIHNAFEKGWIERWQRNGWKTADKKPVDNQDLWMGILEASAVHRVRYNKVKGHADDKYNNMCDELARKAIKENTVKKGEP
ncbi:MAG: ribonuclease HI [Christensenellaceae bacterium]|nr:ribonuclease HI [Christensenellaceae bacterium]